MTSEKIAPDHREDGVSHRFVEINGLQMHIAEKGSGPLVVLCHGFPEFWYIWNAQISALAAAGYHVVAPDQRGYGQTDQPEASASYTLLHLVADMVGLLDVLGEQQAVIIGHDWGANVAWHAALLRPDRFRAVACLSVPYIPRGPIAGPRSPSPTEAMQKISQKYFFYQYYFQEPGVAEAELERDVRTAMRRMFYGLAGDTPRAERWHPITPDLHATMLGTVPDPALLPSWLSEEMLNGHIETFQRTGFRGGLNWYRAVDLNWELLSAYSGAQITSPALFIWGDQDPLLEMPGVGKSIENLSHTVPHLRSTMLPGAGHWIQLERAAEVNSALLAFLLVL
jgi:pimeloyl-ACP methyl ester carboxylesterase